MNEITTRGVPFAPDFTPSRVAAPPPARRRHVNPGAAFLTRTRARFGVTSLAIAVVLAVVALSGLAVAISAGTTLSLPAVLVGLGASAIVALRLLAGRQRGLPRARHRVRGRHG